MQNREKSEIVKEKTEEQWNYIDSNLENIPISR